MWLGMRARTAFAGTASVVKLQDGQFSAAPLSPPSLTSPPSSSASAVGNDALIDDSSVEHAAAALANGTAPSSATPGLLPAAMGDLFSLSLFQFLSILSFLTSLLAVVRVGSVSLHRFSQQHKSFAADVPEPEMHTTMKLPSWSLNWGLSGLPVSFSLNTLIGEDEAQPEMDEKRSIVQSGYTGGASLVRMPMDWQVNRTRIGTSHIHPSSFRQLTYSSYSSLSPPILTTTNIDGQTHHVETCASPFPGVPSLRPSYLTRLPSPSFNEKRHECPDGCPA